jgi:hypothetical protein
MKDLKILYDYAMGQIMEKEAITHKHFFTQEEFEKNRGKIYIISGAFQNLARKPTLKKSKS